MRVQRTNALPAEEGERIFPILELVPMPLGDAVCEPGVPMRHVYFPTTCIVSLLNVMEDGASAEIAVVGNEGIVGISLPMQCLLLRYTQALLTQMAQTAVCNRHHFVGWSSVWDSTLQVSLEARQVEWLTETQWRREPPDTRGQHRGPRVRRWASMALRMPPHRLRSIMRLTL